MTWGVSQRKHSGAHALVEAGSCRCAGVGLNLLGKSQEAILTYIPGDKAWVYPACLHFAEEGERGTCKFSPKYDISAEGDERFSVLGNSLHTGGRGFGEIPRRRGERPGQEMLPFSNAR